MVATVANNRKPVTEWEENIGLALERFMSPDEETSRRGFEKLHDLCYPYTLAVARSLKGDHRDEAVQQAWVNVWAARIRYRPNGAKAWLGYLAVVTRNCVSDVIKRSYSSVDVELLDESVEPYFWEAIHEAILNGSLEKAIGEVWCDFPICLSTLDRKKRVAAAAMLMIHGKPLPEVRSVFFPGLPAHQADTRLEQWIEDPPTLRDLAFRTLFCEGRQLTAGLLGVDPGAVVPLYGAAVGGRNDDPPAGWNWNEVAAVVQRYFMNRTVEDIEKELACDFSAIGDRCRALFPFLSRMKSLKTIFGKQGHLLGEIKLWKRVAFHAWYGERLRQKEILERYEETAMEGGYASFNAGNLNVWIGNQRLVNELLRHIKEQGIDL